MGKEADTSYYHSFTAGEEDAGKVLEWEVGLPSAEDLTPLSQPLITPELASAFSITLEPSRTLLDVHRASQNTLSALRLRIPSSSYASAAFKTFPSFTAAAASTDDPMIIEGDESTAKDGGGAESYSRRLKRSDAMEEVDSALRTENSVEDPNSARMPKRPRLVWTPQLHKRFVDVVAHLGIKNAVPKTIMQLMNVEGLTRENVASHLQKYRLYLKRMQGLSNEGPSSSDHLFASTPVPQSLQEMPVPVPMSYAAPPTLIPMPIFGMPHHRPGAPVAMVPVYGQHCSEAYHGFEPHHPYGVFGERQKDWSGGNKFGQMVSYPPRVAPNDK